VTQLQSPEQIGAIIKARIESCTVANGAETDLGVKVYRGRRSIDDTMMPCASLIEAEESPVQADGRRRADVKVETRVSAHAFVPCDPNDPNLAAHAAIRDLKRALFSTNGQADTTLGGAVEQLRYLGSDIGTRADGAAFVTAIVDVAVTHFENLASPQ
jgi:hypothetical protein